jgi:putative phosphoribosyl transferase
MATPLDAPIRDVEVSVSAGTVSLARHLVIPPRRTGTVIFVHGSGSSRHSPRNRFVATALNRAGFATLLFDLLTIEEERDRARVFDVDLLASRLIAVTEWTRGQPELSHLPIGYFGASTGAGAALIAAADPRVSVAAVVSRGGRPDLAGAALSRVRVPTLLIVGGDDHPVLELNRSARSLLGGPSALTVVPGATHVFEEPGTLDAVADAACGFLRTHLRGPDGPATPGPTH